MAKLTLSQFQKKVEKFARNNPRAVARALGSGAELVRSEAVQEHFGGSRSGGGGFSGERLKNQTGTLRQSITTRIKASDREQSAIVSTNVIYAAVHEYGFRHIPRRPYLRPSLEDKRKEVLDLILRTIMQEYRNAG